MRFNPPAELLDFLTSVCREESPDVVVWVKDRPAPATAAALLAGLATCVPPGQLHVIDGAEDTSLAYVRLPGLQPRIHVGSSIRRGQAVGLSEVIDRYAALHDPSWELSLPELLGQVEAELAATSERDGLLPDLLGGLPPGARVMVILDGAATHRPRELELARGADFVVVLGVLGPLGIQELATLRADPDYVELYHTPQGDASVCMRADVRVKSWTTIEHMVSSIDGLLMEGQDQWLFETAARLPTDALLVEIGAFRGRSTAALGNACRGTRRKVITIDPWRRDQHDENFSLDDFERWQEGVERLRLGAWVEAWQSTSEDALSRWAQLHMPTMDLCFIDGSHQHFDVLRDVRMALRHLRPGAWLAMHDVVPTWPGPWAVWHGLTQFLLDNPVRVASLTAGQLPSWDTRPTCGRFRHFPEAPQGCVDEGACALTEPALHVLTLALNAEPFIRHHIRVLSQLPFVWHWHIVEGVADLVEDTAWSLPGGGHIPEHLHRAGRSIDGTSDYLDTLKEHFPGHVHVYRRPPGQLWRGKVEMVNAPLSTLPDDAILLQIDADELWTAEQLARLWERMCQPPTPSAMWFRCRFYITDRHVLTSPGGYGQNDSIEWLRVWRFKQPMRFVSHEPPLLVDTSGDDVGIQSPLLHDETQALGLTFDHLAYVTPAQLSFKEAYYGYAGARERWEQLRASHDEACDVASYLPWVGHEVHAGSIQSNPWLDTSGATPHLRTPSLARPESAVVIDALAFQFLTGGIPRVWHEVLRHWMELGLEDHLVIIDRGGLPPELRGGQRVPFAAYDYEGAEHDRYALEQVCEDVGASVFVSTYYTTPLQTPSVAVIHDMIPELLDWDCDAPMWREKHRSILLADHVICVSQQTALDLRRLWPDISPTRITVAENGVRPCFYPAPHHELAEFKERFALDRPWLLFIGNLTDYKNGALLLQALELLPTRSAFVLFVVTSDDPAPLADQAPPDVRVVTSPLTDEELRAAYSGAAALVYPSLYEGFGLPIVEAQRCGCPVITTRSGPLPDVAGRGALFVPQDDPSALARALARVQDPQLRQRLTRAGHVHSGRFDSMTQARLLWDVLVKTGAQGAR